MSQFDIIMILLTFFVGSAVKCLTPTDGKKNKYDCPVAYYEQYDGEMHRGTIECDGKSCWDPGTTTPQDDR